jgi:signal transduction histidine kinase
VRDPNLIPLFIFGTLLVTAFAVAVVISLVIQKQRQVKNRLERQRLEFNYSQTILHTKIEVQETTLKMLSQELHDNINQVLSACFMQITSAGNRMQDTDGKAMIEEAKGTIKGAISDIRLLSHSLNTGMVEHRETEEAIESELTRIQAFSNIACTLDADATVDLPAEQRLLVFRIVQEALQNIIKHAQAKNITISISNTDKQYMLSIKDDGRGFDSKDAGISSSLGMRNMQERAALLKGVLKFTSSPGHGTMLELQIPINQ